MDPTKETKMDKSLILEVAGKLEDYTKLPVSTVSGKAHEVSISRSKLERYARELRMAVGEAAPPPEPDKESAQTVEEILERATDKVVDWGQQTALGIAGTADAVADRLREWADGARRDEQRERDAGIR